MTNFSKQLYDLRANIFDDIVSMVGDKTIKFDYPVTVNICDAYGQTDFEVNALCLRGKEEFLLSSIEETRIINKYELLKGNYLTADDLIVLDNLIRSYRK